MGGANESGQMSKEVLVQYYIRCRPQQKISPASPRSPLSPRHSSAQVAKQALLEETPSIAAPSAGRKQKQTSISEKEISVSKAPGQVSRTEHVVSTISDGHPQRDNRTKMTTTTTTTRSRQSHGGRTGTSEEDKWVAREARAKERLEQQKNEELAQDQETKAALEAMFIPLQSSHASAGPDDLLHP